jgi:hypothetical protein
MGAEAREMQSWQQNSELLRGKLPRKFIQHVSKAQTAKKME